MNIVLGQEVINVRGMGVPNPADLLAFVVVEAAILRTYWST